MTMALEASPDPFFGSIDPQTDPRDCKYYLKPDICKRIMYLFDYYKNNPVDEIRFDDNSMANHPGRESFETDFHPKVILNKLNELEDIFDEARIEYDYEDVNQIFNSLQYIDDNFSNTYFYNFLENHVEIACCSAMRKSKTLDQKMRKLKRQSVKADAEQIEQNVARLINLGAKRGLGGAGGTTRAFLSRFTLSEELRNIRGVVWSTLSSIILIVATFFFFYFAFVYVCPDYNSTQRVLYSFVFSMAVAATEVYFLLKLI